MFIRPRKKENTITLSRTQGVSSDCSNKKITTKVLKLEIINADERLAQLFECHLDTPIYYIERLRYMDDIPYALEYTYYNKTIIPYIGKEIAENSIFNYIKNDLGITFGFADKYLDVVKLDKEKSELLQLEENDPSLMIEDHIYTNAGYIFNISNIYYNYHLSHFYVSNI